MLKSGEKRAKKRRRLKIFRRRGFWAQFFWLLFMLAFCALGIACRSISVFSVGILSAFLGLNEFGRWSYRKNLIICSAVSIAGSLAGAFAWLETAAIFALMCVTGGFVLYYRDSVRDLLPAMYRFSDVLAYCDGVSEVCWKTRDMLAEMLPGCKIYVMAFDGVSRLYLPERENRARAVLNRQGGVVWRCFNSGLSCVRENVSPKKDLPLHRDARSLIAAPMIAGGETLGVIEIDSEMPFAFSEEDRDRLSLLAFLTAQALQKYMTG